MSETASTDKQRDFTWSVEIPKQSDKVFAKHSHTLIIKAKGKTKKWALDHKPVDMGEVDHFAGQA